MAPLYFLCSSLLALSIFYPGCALRDADEDSARIGDDILIGDSIYQMVVDGQQISRSRPERGTVLSQELEVRSLYHIYSLKTKSSQCHYVVMTS